MARRIAALLGKELAQHGWVLIGLALFMPAAWAMLAAFALMAPATVTYLDAHAGMMRFFVPLAGLALGNRLVVAEYHGRTQLFVEALPIRRLEMLGAKLGLGLAALLAIALGSLAASLALAASREPIDLPFAAILAARSAGFVLALWSVFFSMGFLGRLRVPLYLAGAIALAVIAAQTELELSRFGPFALVGADLALEREALPVQALGQSLAIAAIALALAVLLATLREGSVAEALSRPMSQRELVTLLLLFFVGLVAIARLDPPDARPPFVFPEGAPVVHGHLTPLRILHDGGPARPAAEALAARLEPELEALARAMRWQGLPTVRVTLAPGLDGGTFEPVELAPHDGILLRANYASGAEWDEDAFVAEVIGRVLDARTLGRARFEPVMWLRDGIARFWPHRAGAELPAPLAVRALWACRERGPDAARLRRWDRLREREGVPIAEALAASGVAVLARARGEEAVMAVARRLFGAVPVQDSRAAIRTALDPVPRVLREEAGLEQAELVRAWSAWLEAARARPALGPALAALPRGASAGLAIEVGAEGARDVVARIRLERAPPAGTTVSLRHLGLGPFDVAIEPWDPAPEDRAWPEGELELELRVSGRYGPRERVWAAVDLALPGGGGGAPLRLAQARLEAVP